MKTIYTVAAIVAAVALTGCDGTYEKSSDKKMVERQEEILQEADSRLGVPNIVNFREKARMKANYERRDQEGVITYTYTFSDVTGKFSFLCNSIGFPLPYATQYSNPEKIAERSSTYGIIAVPQAEPNGLFMPSSAEGSWVDCVNPNTKGVSTVYMEPRVAAFEFALPEGMLAK